MSAINSKQYKEQYPEYTKFMSRKIYLTRKLRELNEKITQLEDCDKLLCAAKIKYYEELIAANEIKIDGARAKYGIEKRE